MVSVYLMRHREHSVMDWAIYWTFRFYFNKSFSRFSSVFLSNKLSEIQSSYKFLIWLLSEFLEILCNTFIKLWQSLKKALSITWPFQMFWVAFQSFWKAFTNHWRIFSKTSVYSDNPKKRHYSSYETFKSFLWTFQSIWGLFEKHFKNTSKTFPKLASIWSLYKASSKPR